MLARNTQDPKSMPVVGKLRAPQRGCSRRLPADRAPQSRFSLERRHEPYISMVAKINSHSRRFLGGLPGDLEGKESAWNAGDLASIPRSGRFLGEGYGNPSRILAWRIPMDSGAWRAAVKRDAQS